MTRDEIRQTVVATMSDLFEIDAEAVKPEARLYEDLGLDSIDAIDLVVKLQELTGRRVNETALKKVRTVSDVVSLVEQQLRPAAA